MISKDDGKSWKIVSNGEEFLHGKTSEKFSPIFTDENLHGILLANSKESKRQNSRPIISFDEGETWQSIKGLEGVSHQFMTTDYGDIIMALKDQEYTDSISLSFDHGHSFRSVPLTEDKFMILHSK